MGKVINRTLIASLAVLTIGLGVAASATPATADPWHGGGGGYHGGGWHGGGGYRGGGWHGGGWGGRGGYGYGYGNDWGPAVGLGIVGGLAAGAMIASQAPYYGGDDCYQYRPIYDQWGQYMGRRPVDVCN
jgi:hypothetical protein